MAPGTIGSGRYPDGVENPDLTQRLDALALRLQRLEDHAAIVRLISAYGPAADRSDGAAIQQLFSEDGTYELEGWSFDHQSMEETVRTDLHARYVLAGSAHVMSLPTIRLMGDRAVAVNYSQVFVSEGDRWVVDRCAANRWELVRTTDGWRINRRVNRLLNGSPASVELLSDGEA
jgi:SnoaL-like domain